MTHATTYEFEHYLSAWMFCLQHGLPDSSISKIGLRLWVVEATTATA